MLDSEDRKPAGRTTARFHFVVEYDRQGQLVRTIGRQGDGPGEFRSPHRLGLVGDTLWVSDDSHRRLSFFGIDGKFIRSEAITGVATTGMSPAMPIALTADGYIIVAPSSNTVGDAQIVQRTVPVMRISRTSKRPDTIALLKYAEKQPSFRLGPKAITYLNDPLPDRPLRSVSPDGRYVLIVERGGWVGWRPGEARVRILESSGETKLSQQRFVCRTSIRLYPPPLFRLMARSGLQDLWLAIRCFGRSTTCRGWSSIA